MALLPLVLLAVSPYFKIRFIDEATGRGIPLVQLRTVNQIRYVSDSAGLVAFNEPGLMQGEVYVHLQSPGYEMKADEFGYRGLRLHPKEGGETTIRLKRVSIAERICRLTGAGIYRDSQLLGDPHPVFGNGGVLGQDTAQAEVYKGRMMWFWGDTDKAGFPLGNFHTSGAVASLPAGGADKGIEFKYFEKGGFVRSMVESKDTHPIWVSGLVVLGDSLYAYYAQMRRLGEISAHGWLKWNDGAERFDLLQTFEKDRGWRFIDGHTIQQDGFILGNNPSNVRVPANEAAMKDAAAYEAFTCLDAEGNVKRVDGKPDYRWQKELKPISSGVEARLVREGKLKIEEAHFLPIDEEGKPVQIAGGSVHYNAYRKKWIGIFGRQHGKDSELGEIDYAEADSPTGPFRKAVKVCDHPKYTFYNPVHHAFLDKGSAIYFEGTYTAEFSGNDDKTPLYNYNQLLYKLDLSDPRLNFAKQ